VKKKNLWAEGVKPTDVHRRILTQYGSVNCMWGKSESG